MSKNIDDFIRANALSNAVDFEGCANPKALIGRVIPEFPDAKKDMKSLMSKINSIVSEINSMSIDEQKKELEKFKSNIVKKEKKIEEKDGLPNMLNTDKKVRVRFEPAPSGYLHLGHLYPLVANYEFKKKFKGEFVLRIADTNPDNIDISNYDKVIEDVKWICEGNIDEIVYQSDRLEIYYKYLRKLFEKNKVYICACKGDKFKELTDKKEECPHAKEDVKTQKEKFENFMNSKYKPGEAVARFRADINHKNPALRTFPLARININNHARVKENHSIWPNMHLAVAVDDVEMSLTHIIRGKDHEINMDRQKMIHDALGIESPDYFHMGRMKFVDMILSKTELSEKIKNKEYEGWDDPRVPSIVSHRKRGYKPEAFRKLILKQGISKRDSKITKDEYYKGLDFFNREILEKESNRAFCIQDRILLEILNIEKIPFNDFQILKHPNIEKNGHRKFKVEKEYYIEKNDFDKLKEEDTIRLMHFSNFKVKSIKKDRIQVEFISKEYDKNLKLNANIHFVPKDSEEIILIMQDNSKVNALCEYIGKIKENTSLQFERYAFVKFDRVENDKKVFYFTHR